MRRAFYAQYFQVPEIFTVPLVSTFVPASRISNISDRMFRMAVRSMPRLTNLRKGIPKPVPYLNYI